MFNLFFSIYRPDKAPRQFIPMPLFACFLCMVIGMILFFSFAGRSVLAKSELGEMRQSILTLAQSGQVAAAKKKAEDYRLAVGKKFGKRHTQYADALQMIATVTMIGGDMVGASTGFRRALQLAEDIGADAKFIARSRQLLGGALIASGRREEGLKLFAAPKAIKPVSGEIMTDQELYAATQRLTQLKLNDPKQFPEGEAIMKKMILWSRSKLGANAEQTLSMSLSLAALYETHDQCAKGEPLLREILDAESNENLSLQPLVVISTRETLARCLINNRKYKEATKLYEQSLQRLAGVFGKDHMLTSSALLGLSMTLMASGQAERALIYSRRYMELEIRRMRIGGVARLEAGPAREVTRGAFETFIRTAWNANAQSAGNKAQLMRDAFIAAQWLGRTRSGEALGQLGIRLASGSDELARIVRNVQNQRERWRQLEAGLMLKLGASKRGEGLQALRVSMEELEAKTAADQKQLFSQFPSYARLAEFRPVSIEEVQDQLGADEALIVLFDTKTWKSWRGETFIWVITGNNSRWVRCDPGTKDLSDKVTLLRRALDPARNVRSGKDRRGVLQLAANSEFDLSVAYDLYEKLLAPVENLLADKQHLMVVATGPLTALPFHLLVTQKPDDSLSGTQKYQAGDWLIRRHAITYLPSVASLKVIRATASGSTIARKSFVGFADPVFSRKMVKSSDSIVTSDQHKTNSLASYFHGALADPQALARLAPLPGTRRELKSIATTLKVPRAAIRLGDNATEAVVKKMSTSGVLDDYRIVYFATHGLVSGDLEKLAEPALALSAPLKPTREDDGLLTASEITTLKLNADWVVMSACNTAAADKPGADALSGLARAFFYAGAKSLLVSHWPVDDRAAVKLMTHTFQTLDASQKTGKPIGKSEALRQAMLAMIKRGGQDANPASWAPFVVVGEGGAR